MERFARSPDTEKSEISSTRHRKDIWRRSDVPASHQLNQNKAEITTMRKFSRPCLLAIVAVAPGLIDCARAEVITFDDLSATAGISGAYAGFNWLNFQVLDTSAETARAGTAYTGYSNSALSGTNVVFNGFGNPAGIASTAPGSSFALTSGYFTAAWNDGLNVTAQGYLNGVLKDTESFTVSTTGPTLETFNWTAIDEVTFSPSGGTPHSEEAFGAGTNFALDNLTVNAVPLPAAAWLLLSGLGALGALARKRSCL
jgi:hypothetical protein